MTDELLHSVIDAPAVEQDAAIQPAEGATEVSTTSVDETLSNSAVAAVEAELTKVEVSIVTDFDSVAAKIKSLHGKLGIDLHHAWDEIVALAKKI